MAQSFPPTDPEPGYTPPTPPDLPPVGGTAGAQVFTPAAPAKRDNRTLMIVLIVLLVLCCCCVAFTVFMYNVGGDWLLDQFNLGQFLPY